MNTEVAKIGSEPRRGRRIQHTAPTEFMPQPDERTHYPISMIPEVHLGSSWAPNRTSYEPATAFSLFTTTYGSKTTSNTNSILLRDSHTSCAEPLALGSHTLQQSYDFSTAPTDALPATTR